MLSKSRRACQTNYAAIADGIYTPCCETLQIDLDASLLLALAVTPVPVENSIGAAVISSAAASRSGNENPKCSMECLSLAKIESEQNR